jgi:3-dehydroquinate synthase
VDTPAGKNLVGAFHQPRAVLIDPDVLATLPPEHRRAGLAEAIKHGIIADSRYFDEVIQLLDDPAADVTRVIAGSVAIKAAVVAEDERESGRRRILNFGHTIGHAIEAASSYSLLHGEAIAIGMVLEARLAERIGVAEAGTATRIVDAVARAGLPHERPAALDPAHLLELTRSDKKKRAGLVEYALPARIGAMAGAHSGWGVPVPDAEVIAVL